MTLTAAERMKKYRERLKLDPQKYEEHKRKHAKLVKEKTKKVTELTDEEKQKQRKKWREQKKKQKENKLGRSNSLNATTKSPKPKKSKVKGRNRSRIARQYKTALQKIYALTNALQAMKKKHYRFKVKSNKQISDLELRLTKMKIREEVMESSLKTTYKKCRTYKQKATLKSMLEAEMVGKSKMKNRFTKLLGLKGKVRKSKERVKFFSPDTHVKVTEFYNE